MPRNSPMETPVVVGPDPIALLPNQIIGISDTTKVRNPFRTAMWVDELRFRADPTVRVRLSLGRHPITNDFIPIPGLCKILNPISEGRDSPAAPFNFFGVPNPPFYWTWRMPKPLYVPSGEYIQTAFMLDSTLPGAPDSATVGYSIAGRSTLDPPPKAVNMAYATTFGSGPIAGGLAVAQSFTSPDSALANPFNVPLRVQRFIGRELRVAPDIGPDFQLTVRMGNSHGGVTIKDPTPFPDAFHYTDRAWTVNTRLVPKGFYSVVIRAPAGYVGPPAGQEPNHVFVTMIGHREVVLA